MKMFSNVLRVLCIIISALAFAWSTSCGSVGAPVSIVVTPAAPSIAVNATQQFTATGVHADGSTVDITATVTWASSDVAVAAFQTTDTSGLATALTGGTVTISATDADSGMVGSTDMTVAALSGTAMALYPNNANWNDYLANDGTDMFTATDTACNAATDGPGYSACLNGGLIRSVEVTGRGVCDGLTATDSLGVFNWACDSNTNDVRMVSVGFADGMGLSDLVDFDAAAWKQLNVTIFSGGNPYLATDMATWWGNTIVVNNTGAAMNAGEVNIVTSDPVSNYTIGANKVVLLVKPGLIMNGANTPGNVIGATSRNFIWFEGAVDAAGDNYGINFNTVKFSVLRNASSQNADVGDRRGVHLIDSLNNLLTNIEASDNNGEGFYLNSSDYNTIIGLSVSSSNLEGIFMDGSSHNNFTDIISVNSAWPGLYIFGNSDNNTFTNVIVANGQSVGIEIDGASNNSLFNVTSSNNSDEAFYLDGGSFNNALANATLVNTVDFGLSFGGAIGIDTHHLIINVTSVNNDSNGVFIAGDGKVTFLNLVSANIDAYGISLSGSSGNNYYTGLLKFGSNTLGNCNGGGAGTGINSDCTPEGSSDFTLTEGIDLTDSFIASASSDSTNADGASGTKVFNEITDWFDFENPYRLWGVEGTFTELSSRGECLGTDTCRIWDWSMAIGGIVVRDVLSLPTGNDTLTHTWLDASTTTFLRNAVEIFDDGIGNENGLCESNETCLYTPNIGSYQGHGTMVSAGAFTDGAITGVTLMQYEANGR